jgi:hypothetical protein
MTDLQTSKGVTLRPAGCADSDALERLAQLDSRPLPPGPHLIGERDGVVQAAICLRTGELVANPFVRTAELGELLRLHAEARQAESTAWRGRPRVRTLGATA